MEIKRKYHCLFIFAVFFFVMLCASCGKKKSDEEKTFAKAQKIYAKGGIEEFSRFVKKNAYFAVADNAKDGATPLLLVLQNRDIDRAKLFVERGASADEADGNGKGCVDYALESRDAAAIDYTLSIMPPAYWNSADKDGVLPLVKVLAQCADYSIVKKAIDFTGDILHADKNGKTTLMYAAQCNVDVRATKYLLDKGVEIDARNGNEWSALMYAARYNPNPAVLEDLLLRGADTEPNSVGLTVTMLASCNQNPGVLLTLLKYKNEANAQTDKGKTALMYACENKQDSAVIKMLIDSGADFDVKDVGGKTALMYALEHYERPESVYVLLAAGADTLQKDSDGKTAKEYLSENKELSATDLSNALNLSKQVPSAEVHEERSPDMDSDTEADENAALEAEQDEQETQEAEPMEIPNETASDKNKFETEGD